MSALTTTGTYLAWRHEPATASTLRLHTSDRDVAVPAAVATALLRDPGRLVTDDPAHDLLLAEQDLRRETRWLASELAEATEEVTLAREEIIDAETGNGFARWWDRRAASAHLAVAATDHTLWSQRHETTVATLAALRGFVIGLDLPRGPLADAAAGWRRDPDPPDYVLVFTTERAFLDVDSRRGVRGWWGGIEPGGVDFGLDWRRDPDDDTHDTTALNSAGPAGVDLVRAGAWRLSYLSRTREVYATRRAPGHTEQVWLLGTGFADEDALTALLTAAEEHMLAPNSLILAAELVHHHARTTQAATATVEGPG
jgi:hypothetical protein